MAVPRTAGREGRNIAAMGLGIATILAGCFGSTEPHTGNAQFRITTASGAGGSESFELSWNPWHLEAPSPSGRWVRFLALRATVDARLGDVFVVQDPERGCTVGIGRTTKLQVGNVTFDGVAMDFVTGPSRLQEQALWLAGNGDWKMAPAFMALWAGNSRPAQSGGPVTEIAIGNRTAMASLQVRGNPDDENGFISWSIEGKGAGTLSRSARGGKQPLGPLCSADQSGSTDLPQAAPATIAAQVAGHPLPQEWPLGVALEAISADANASHAVSEVGGLEGLISWLTYPRSLPGFQPSRTWQLVFQAPSGARAVSVSLEADIKDGAPDWTASEVTLATRAPQAVIYEVDGHPAFNQTRLADRFREILGGNASHFGFDRLGNRFGGPVERLERYDARFGLEGTSRMSLWVSPIDGQLLSAEWQGAR